ncbi:MAG: amidohydrolase family protein [Victivallales bacterium]|nr:amidohydrolase family protein [Victivallales bacterium]
MTITRIPDAYEAIDAHNHVWAKDGKLNVEDAQNLLEAATDLGIGRICVSVPLLTPCPAPEEFRKCNNIVFEAMRRSDRFIGFCFVNPGYVRETLEEIKRCIIDGGMAGVKLYHQYSICDPVLIPLLEKAAEFKFPVLMHAGKVMDATTRETQPRLSNAEHFIKAAERFPDTTFIQAHIGGGGDWEWNLRMLEDSPENIYLDTGGSVIDAGMVKKTVAVLGDDRVLFATDMSFEEGVGKILDAGLSETQMRKICHDNIAEILNRRKVG